jgi:hypothetical protein
MRHFAQNHGQYIGDDQIERFFRLHGIGREAVSRYAGHARFIAGNLIEIAVPCGDARGFFVIIRRQHRCLPEFPGRDAENARARADIEHVPWAHAGLFQIQHREQATLRGAVFAGAERGGGVYLQSGFITRNAAIVVRTVNKKRPDLESGELFVAGSEPVSVGNLLERPGAGNNGRKLGRIYLMFGSAKHKPVATVVLAVNADGNVEIFEFLCDRLDIRLADITGQNGACAVKRQALFLALVVRNFDVAFFLDFLEAADIVVFDFDLISVVRIGILQRFDVF